MNNQEIYDTVVRHLYEQGHQALTKEAGICAYRTARGDKCAVGVLIPDNLYVPKMEGRACDSLLNKFPALKAMFPDHDALPLLENLQSVHDFENNWDSNGLSGLGIHELRVAAQDYKLSTEVLDKLYPSRV